MAKSKKKFKALDKKTSTQWEGEELQAESKIRLEEDHGTGPAVVLRFFDFGTNLQTFKEHKPTAQELFNSHRHGIEALLWKDGLAPFDQVQPRLMFSKNKKFYRFIIPCVPKTGTIIQKPKTLSELLVNPPVTT